jgi:fatty acid desaturase
MELIDHKALLARLTRAERQELTLRSDLKGFLHLVGHAGAILISGALILTTPLWPAALIVHGILIVFLFTTLHETIHKTAFRTDRINSALAQVCGLVLLLPPRWFRYFHFAHHRFTHDPERDPELRAPKPETPRDYLVHLSGLPLWWSHIRTLVVNALGRNRDGFVPANGRAGVMTEARSFLALYAVALGASLSLRTDVLVWVWLLPILLGQPFLRAYLLAEHTRCPHVANMLANSRTTFTNRLIRFLAWNMPYHAEHHACPAVPFHKLPRFHRYAAVHLAATERGYTRFHRKLVASMGRSEPHGGISDAAGEVAPER